VQRPVQGAVSAPVEPVPHDAPLLASSGLVPPRAANAASLRHRPGCENDTMAWAALTGPMPRRSINPGTMSLTMVCSWGAVGLELAVGLAQGEGQAADLGVPHSLLAARIPGEAAPGQAGQASVGECAAGVLAGAVRR
jgi:hypothetical protein